MLNRKATITLLIIGLIKKTELNKMNYSSVKQTRSTKNLKTKLDLSNYATKFALTGADTSNMAIKSDLVSIKSDFHELNIEKLKNIPSGLNSLKSKED